MLTLDLMKNRHSLVLFVAEVMAFYWWLGLSSATKQVLAHIYIGLGTVYSNLLQLIVSTHYAQWR